MNWDDLKIVLAVARERTQSAAARRLRVNQTTVARRLAAIEGALAVRLFERTDGTHVPTDVGAELIERAEAIEADMLALEASVAGRDAAAVGTVRVTSVPILVNRLLAPAVPALRRDHPDLRLELIAEPRSLSLTRREADIALRLARPVGGVALARRIGTVAYAVYRSAGDATPDPPWITYEEALEYLPQARWIHSAMGGAHPSLCVNDAEALLAAVRTGVGRSVLPCFVGEADSALVRVGGQEPVMQRELWLLVHRDLRPLARVGAVLDWIVATVRSARPDRCGEGVLSDPA